MKAKKKEAKIYLIRDKQGYFISNKRAKWVQGRYRYAENFDYSLILCGALDILKSVFSLRSGEQIEIPIDRLIKISKSTMRS